jgi:hypothetical protein
MTTSGFHKRKGEGRERGDSSSIFDREPVTIRLNRGELAGLSILAERSQHHDTNREIRSAIHYWIRHNLNSKSPLDSERCSTL